MLVDDFFKLEEAWLRFEQLDGSMSAEVRRLNLDRGDSAAAVLHDPVRDVVVLVNQFRYSTHRNGDGWIVELVAGMCLDENPEDAIRREVLEEVGLEARALEPVGVFYATPGGSNERIFLYYALLDSDGRTARGGGLSSENEDIEVLEFSTAEAFERLDRGNIRDAKTIIGLQWLRRKLERTDD